MPAALSIGKVEIASRVLVAPMSGVTDLPFRRVLQRYDPGYVVSEMVAGKELVEGNADTELRASGAGDIEPLVIQLVGNDPDWMAAGAAHAETLGAAIIDINMGCPARKVTTGLSGSALMRDLDHACLLIKRTIAATDLPVTLKMRLGWDDTLLNAPELAKRAEDLGITLITVHGRTRCQFYEGQADWHAVKAVVDTVKIPVVVNGDILDAKSASTALQHSSADAVMIGRGLVGRPWNLLELKSGLGEAAPADVPEPIDVVTDHYTDIIAHYGERRGVRVARKHVQGYLKSAGADADRTRYLMRCTEWEDVREGLAAVYGRDRAA